MKLFRRGGYFIPGRYEQFDPMLVEVVGCVLMAVCATSMIGILLVSRHCFVMSALQFNIVVWLTILHFVYLGYCFRMLWKPSL